MPSVDELKPGLTATVEIVVGTRDTAAHVGSGKIGVKASGDLTLKGSKMAEN